MEVLSAKLSVGFVAVVAVSITATIVLGIAVVCATTLTLSLATPVGGHWLERNRSDVTLTIGACLNAGRKDASNLLDCRDSQQQETERLK